MDAYEKLRKREKAKLRATWGELPQMTSEILRLACIEHDGYETQELNDKIYLHFKGFRSIQNLEPYYGLKCIFLESNAITQITGLSHLKQLKSLYLQQNQITKISGLDELSNLSVLNLSENKIHKIEGLLKLPNLSTLYLAKNLLQDKEDIEELKQINKLTTLDISNNKIHDGPEVIQLLSELPKLAVLHLNGNPMVSTTKHYRKTVVSSVGYIMKQKNIC